MYLILLAGIVPCMQSLSVPPNAVTPKQKITNIVAFGDSWTDSRKQTQAKYVTWVAQLSTHIGATINNFAQSGAISDNLSKQFIAFKESKQLKVSIPTTAYFCLIGLNDYTRAHKDLICNKDRSNCKFPATLNTNILNNIKKLTTNLSSIGAKKIYILNIPAMTAKRSAKFWKPVYANMVTKSQSNFNANLLKIKGIQVIDLYAFFLLNKPADIDYYEGDHPNTKYHEKIAKFVAQRIGVT